jgi:hypothetical protein
VGLTKWEGKSQCMGDLKKKNLIYGLENQELLQGIVEEF